MIRSKGMGMGACTVVGVLSLLAIEGCGSNANRLGLPPGRGTPSEDYALLTARAVPLPDSGAVELANTAWSGEGTCELTGDVGISINEDPRFPAEIEFAFDEGGFPVGFFDGVLAVAATYPSTYPIFGLGAIFGMAGEVPPVPKRADFTAQSFDLAYTRTFTYEMMGSSMEEGELATLEATLSDDDTELTGTLRVTHWTAVSSGGEKETITTGQHCVFTLYRDK